jgi:hypothetical protein
LPCRIRMMTTTTKSFSTSSHATTCRSTNCRRQVRKRLLNTESNSNRSHIIARQC